MSNWTTAPPTLKLPRFEPEPEPIALVEGGLVGRVRPVSDLTASERDEMHALLGSYFEQVSRARFEADLTEKESAILLTDGASGAVQGFSTLMRMQVQVGERRVVAFFSGDTIVARDHWGETLLPRLWARHVFGLAESIKGAEVYWFLISSGYKTYRFLPVFFREFYPAFDRATPPAVKQVLDSLALQKFGAEYDAARGVVRFAQPSPLRSSVAELTGRRLRDPHVAFFVAANSGHAEGDELACITRVVPENLTPAGRRMLGL